MLRNSAASHANLVTSDVAVVSPITAVAYAKANMFDVSVPS